MNFKNLDLKTGTIIYNDFDFDQNACAKDQDLDEDLMQISFSGNAYIIDLGWYTTPCGNGNFKIRIIKDLNWQNPILTEAILNFNDLERKLQECINLAAECVQQKK